MVTRYTCTQGHEWEALEATASGETPRCPVCATQFDTPPAPAADPWATSATPTAPPPLESPMPALVPGYDLLEELGRGGMGVVYRARQVGLGRVVALKMILGGGHAGSAERARFQTEAEAAARLQHANIVQVFEVGQTEAGPFLALEFVPGGSLAQRLAAGPLPSRHAAVLIDLLARAVQHAHERGIVHRDLKPANVLLASGAVSAPQESAPPGADATGLACPKITDFGLARRLDVESGQTVTGAVMGTPCYMAPEQASGHARAAGPLADVYALGAILYECLTGRPPFVGPTAYATLEQVCTQEPVPPARLQPAVPRDLETVCLKCLDKVPTRRYGSAADLADDLKRFLDGEPIVARPVGPLERAVKWARRRPAIAGLLALVLAVTLAGLGLVLWQWQRAESARHDALAAAGAEAHAKDEALTALREAKEARRLEKQQRQAAETARDEAQEQLYLSNIALAHRDWLANNLDRSLELLNECPRRRRGWEWHYLKGLHSAGLLRLRPHGPGMITAVAYSPCGHFLAAACRADNVVICDAHTGDEKFTLGGAHLGVLALAYSRDGKVLATAGQDGTVRVWDARTGAAGAVLKGHQGPVHCVALSADGCIASGGADQTIRVWDLATGTLRHRLTGHTGPVTCLAFSRDGKVLVSGSRNPDTTVRAWEVHSGCPLYTLPPFIVAVTGVAFSPDGNQLAVATGVGRRLYLYQSGTGKFLQWLNFASAGSVNALAFRPGGRQVAIACQNRQVLLYDFQTTQTLTYRGHAGAVQCLAWAPDGTRLASGSVAGEVWVWDARSAPDATTRTVKGSLRQMAFSPDGKLMALAIGVPLGRDLEPTGPAEVRLVETATGKPVRTLPGPRSGPASLAFSPDGTRLAALWRDRSITLWEVSSGRLLHRLQGAAAWLPSGPWSRIQVGFSADGQRALLGSDVLQVWDVSTGRELRRWALKGISGPIWGLAFSPGCRRLVTATLNGTLQFWDSNDGKEAARRLGPWAPGAMAFDCTGSLLAISAGGTTGSRLVLYDAGSGKEVRSFAGHGGLVNWLAFSPDGTRLASGGEDNAVKLWDVVSGRELLSLEGHDRGVTTGGFSPDGVTLASGDSVSDTVSTVRLWRGDRSREVFAWGKRGRLVMALAYAPDGRTLADAAEMFAGAVVRDALTGRRLFNVGQLEGNVVPSSLAFRPDSRELAIGQGNNKDTGKIEIVDMDTRKRRWLLDGHKAVPLCLSYRPDGKRLASASHDHTACVWDLQTGKRLLTFRGHSTRVHGIAFSPDGRHVASTGGEGVVRVWDASTGEEKLRLNGPHAVPGTLLLTPDLWSVLPNLRVNRVSLGCVVYSPDGNFLAAAGLGELPFQRVVIVWDAHTGKPLRSLRGHQGHVYQVAYRPDGRVLASASGDRTVRLWDADTGRELLKLTGHDATVFRLAFSPDGKQLASCSFDGSVRVWDVADIVPPQ
jgi:WD40 repeat protein